MLLAEASFSCLMSLNQLRYRLAVVAGYRSCSSSVECGCPSASKGPQLGPDAVVSSWSLVAFSSFFLAQFQFLYLETSNSATIDGTFTPVDPLGDIFTLQQLQVVHGSDLEAIYETCLVFQIHCFLRRGVIQRQHISVSHGAGFTSFISSVT